jgi:hypothetical protein
MWKMFVSIHENDGNPLKKKEKFGIMLSMVNITKNLFIGENYEDYEKTSVSTCYPSHREFGNHGGGFCQRASCR